MKTNGNGSSKRMNINFPNTYKVKEEGKETRGNQTERNQRTSLKCKQKRNKKHEEMQLKTEVVLVIPLW